MNNRTINDRLSVAGQIAATDMQDIAKAGFKSVICNRPDGEGFDQPSFAEIETAAKQLGIMARYIPVEAGHMSELVAADFAKAMDELPKPVLAYCRSGARSTMMWEMSQMLNPSAKS